MSRPKKSIWWFEPRWSFVPRLFHDIQDARLVWALLRALLVSTVIAAGIAFVVTLNFPRVKLNWPLMYTQAVILILFLIATHLVYALAVPPIVSITRQRSEEIESVNLIVYNEERIAIWLTLPDRCCRYGVSTRVKLRDLAELLGDKLTVHDHRQSCHCGYSPVQECIPSEVLRLDVEVRSRRATGRQFA